MSTLEHASNSKEDSACWSPLHIMKMQARAAVIEEARVEEGTILGDSMSIIAMEMAKDNGNGKETGEESIVTQSPHVDEEELIEDGGQAPARRQASANKEEGVRKKKFLKADLEATKSSIPTMSLTDFKSVYWDFFQLKGSKSGREDTTKQLLELLDKELSSFPEETSNKRSRKAPKKADEE